MASPWPIPALRVGANGSEAVINYPSLPAVILSLKPGLNELGNPGRGVLVEMLILPPAKYVIGNLPRR